MQTPTHDSDRLIGQILDKSEGVFLSYSLKKNFLGQPGDERKRCLMDVEKEIARVHNQKAEQ